MIYALLLDYPLTGHTTVRTYATAFDRALEMILLRDQPVVLRTVDYAPTDMLRMAKADL